MWTTIRKTIQKTTAALSFAGMFMVIPMMLLTSAEVVGRAVWSRPIPGTVELSSYLLAIFVLLGIAYTQQVKGHVRVEMLLMHLPDRVAAAVDLCTTLLSLFIIGLLAWQGWFEGVEEKAVSDMLRIPQWPFKLLVSVAGGLLFLELAIDLGGIFRRLAGRET